VVGTVGAGKSTLFQAILREISPTSGHLLTKGSIAYASQDPWLFDASVSYYIIILHDQLNAYNLRISNKYGSLARNKFLMKLVTTLK
jgi:ATPase subunit of ABC transporter with duplicated ATPase domains